MPRETYRLTFLRNNWYNENYLPQLASAAESGVLMGSTHGGTVASASRANFAAAAAVVLTTPGHDNVVYELSGDTAYDYTALAAAIGAAIGKPVTYTDLTTEAHVAALKQVGLDQATAEFVAQIDAGIAAGALSEVSPDLARLIGRPTTPLIDTLRAAAA